MPTSACTIPSLPDAPEPSLARLEARGLFRLVVAVGSIALVSRFFGAGKDLIVADKLGTSDLLDAFLMASLVPLFVTNTISASFGEAFVPVFVRARDQQGHAQAQRLLAGATALTLTTLVAVTIPLALLMRPLLETLARGFSEDKITLTAHMALILLPMQIIGGLSACWAHVLNASGQARRTALTPILAPLLTAIVLIAGGGGAALYALIGGLLGGAVLEAIALGLSVRALGFDLVPRWIGLTPELRRFASQCLPLAGASFLATGSSLIDQAMASWLGSGAISQLSYANKITMMVLGIANVALTAVLYPHFAKLVAAEDFAGLRTIFRRYTIMLLLAGAIGAAILIAISGPVISVLFERGSFHASDTAVVARVQQLYLLQLPFHLAGIIGVRLVSALGKNRLLLIFTLITGVLNAVANYLFMQKWGVAGIALSTSLVFLTSFIMVWFTTRELLKSRS
jgi:putative peptidoglycan lipid II flippase